MINIEGEDENSNANIPRSQFYDTFYTNEQKVLAHLQKIDPTKPFGRIRVKVESSVKQVGKQNDKSGSNNRGKLIS